MTIRYRMLDQNDDFVFGRGSLEFLVDSPQAVLQAIRTRFRLFEGEWFLDTSAGTPWFQSILGENTKPLYDQAIRERILSTQGVATIEQYASLLDPKSRKLVVKAAVTTIPFPGIGPPHIGRLDIDFSLSPGDFNVLG